MIACVKGSALVRHPLGQHEAREVDLTNSVIFTQVSITMHNGDHIDKSVPRVHICRSRIQDYSSETSQIWLPRGIVGCLSMTSLRPQPSRKLLCLLFSSCIPSTLEPVP